MLLLISNYANIGKKLSDKIHCNTRNTINSYLKQNIISSLAFECVEANDVLKIISDLAPKNSCGIDHISFKLLKRISIIIATGSYRKPIVMHWDFSR